MRFCIFLFSLLISVSGPATSSVTVFTDSAAWQASLPAVVLSSETFAGSRLDMAGNSSLSIGLLDLKLNGGASDPGPTGLSGNGFLQGEVDNGSDPLSLEISFDPVPGFAVIGLQNDSVTNPAKLALDEIALSIHGQNWILSDFAGAAVSDLPFLGFSSSLLISGFTLSHASLFDASLSRRAEEFYIDAVVLAQPVALVAEPPLMTLFVLGTLIIFAAKRRMLSCPVWGHSMGSGSGSSSGF